MHDAPTGVSEPGRGKSYLPEESPLADLGDFFAVNTGTPFGQNLQDRIDLAYTMAVLSDSRRKNPDTGETMLAGDEALLGTIYFDEEGRFEDIWDIKYGEHEERRLGLPFPPSPTNIGRWLYGPEYEANVPIVKGRARMRHNLDLPIFIEGID